MKKFGILFLVGYALSGGVGVADAATYYTAKTGSNSNSCVQAQSLATPKLTVNAGVGCLAAGDTLLVRAGTYDEGLTTAPSGTSWNNKVRIAAYPGDTVWMTPLSDSRADGMVVEFQGSEKYIEFDGINFDGRNISRGVFNAISYDGVGDPNHIRVMNGENIARSTDQSSTSPFAQWGIGFGGHGASVIIGGNEIINMTIHGGGRPGTTNPDNGYGIYLAGPNNLVDHCDIYDPKGIGIHIYNGAGASPDNNIIRNTRIHDITRWSVPGQVQGVLVVGNNNQVYNNLIYNIMVGSSAGDGGIAATGSGNKFWNNTIYNNTNGIYLDGGASNTEIRNNIVYGSKGSNFNAGGTGTIQSNNLIGVDPLFVDKSANNLQLQSGSPAVNAGAVVSSVTTDFAGLPRPQGPMPDIGAYEFGAGTAGESGPPSAPAGLRILGAK